MMLVLNEVLKVVKFVFISEQAIFEEKLKPK
jgi:hypothetical protein